jgi:hypothetical protein
MRSAASDREPAIETFSSNFQHPFHDFTGIDIVVHYQYLNIRKGYVWRR